MQNTYPQNTPQSIKEYNKECSSEDALKWLAPIEEYQKQNEKRFDEIKKFVNKVGDLKDPKDALDLQLRIQAEQANLLNEVLRKNLIRQEHDAKRYAEEQKLKQNSFEFSHKEPTYKW